MTSTLDALLWGVLPYVTIAAFVIGLFWRYRYDKFGWTTRSSQLYENRLLRWGSPMFHFGLILVILGHLVGLLIPKSWTEAVGIPEAAYHFVATWMGSFGALLVVAGLIILIVRRRTTGPVFSATTRMDKTMYVFLAASILIGSWATVETQILAGDHGYDYRETISPWFRSIFVLQPEPALMAGVPWRSSCTSSPPSSSSSCGPSRGSCTRSRPPCRTSSARTWSTARATPPCSRASRVLAGTPPGGPRTSAPRRP